MVSLDVSGSGGVTTSNGTKRRASTTDGRRGRASPPWPRKLERLFFPRTVGAPQEVPFIPTRHQAKGRGMRD